MGKIKAMIFYEHGKTSFVFAVILLGFIIQSFVPANLPPSVDAGPDTVFLDNINVEDTIATFPGAEQYILHLAADDCEFTSTDEMIVTVVDPFVSSADVRVADSSDDDEERSSASINLTGSDLELVVDFVMRTSIQRILAKGKSLPPFDEELK